MLVSIALTVRMKQETLEHRAKSDIRVADLNKTLTAIGSE